MKIGNWSFVWYCLVNNNNLVYTKRNMRQVCQTRVAMWRGTAGNQTLVVYFHAANKSNGLNLT